MRHLARLGRKKNALRSLSMITLIMKRLLSFTSWSRDTKVNNLLITKKKKMKPSKKRTRRKLT